MKKKTHVERITLMESHLDCALHAVKHLEEALDEYEHAAEALASLADYYASKEWLSDLDDDRNGLLPEGLKRGVLAEDSIWNLLTDAHELNERMRLLSQA